MFKTVAIVGATGLVGQEMFKILQSRAPWSAGITSIKLFASAKSVGRKLSIFGREIAVEALRPGCFEGCDLVFFDASDAVSLEWAPQAAASGAWVVDHSGAFRMDPEVHLSVPEVNGDELKDKARPATGKAKLIAGPNCSTVQLVMALEPMRRLAPLQRVVVSTYQSVSGAGSKAQEELRSGSAPEVFPYPILHNLIPRIGGVGADGYSSEERKIMEESKKILGLPNLKIVATTVRVPTLVTHAETVAVEFGTEVSIESLRAAWEQFPGVKLLDDAAHEQYPTPLMAAGTDPVWIGRVRRDPSVVCGYVFWIVADNLRKGAALNAIQIAETLPVG